MSEIDPPPPNYDGYVDIKKFWEAVTIEMISIGFRQVCLVSLFRYTVFNEVYFFTAVKIRFVIRWNEEPFHCAAKLQLLGSVDWKSY